MRFIIAVCALLFLCSAARADRIFVTSASATYFTATDSLDIRVRVNEPIDLNSDYFGFGAWTPLGAWPPTEAFSIRNDDGRNDRDEIMEVVHTTYASPHNIKTPMGTADYSLDEDRMGLRFILPLQATGMESPLFSFSASVIGEDSWSVPVEGQSSIDQRVIYTPEPSAVALACIGMLGLAAHRLARRPRLRL